MGLFRKGGGGFLNNVDATITGYQWSDEFNGEPFVPGKNAKGGDKFHSLNFVLSSRVDGADQDQTTTLFGGAFDSFEVSEDGFVLTPNVDGYQLGGGTAVATFIESMIAAEPKLEDVLTPYDFRAIIGARVRFVQQVNAETTAKLGKVKDKKDPKKSYDRKDLVVDQVYSLGAAPKAVAAKGAKAKGVNVEELAAETLLAIVEGAGGSIKKAKLSMAALKALKGDPNTAEIRTLFANDEFLGSQDGLSFDEETQVVSVDA